MTHAHRRPLLLTRRSLLVDLGRLTLGAVVLGSAVACSDGGSPAGDSPTTGAPDPAPSTAPTATTAAATDAGDTSAAAPRWARVDLDFVFAYVVVRDGEAAVIDTGVEGSEGAIEAVLTDLGSQWSDVAHVILTHRHPDHAGSTVAVLEAAADATGYAGAADLSAINSPRSLQAVGDGDTVMGLDVIETPGHTAGHIAVLDPDASVLFTGDALNGAGAGGEATGGVGGPNPSFSDDIDTAWESVRKLGELTFDTALFGHGSPLEGQASTKVAALQQP